MITLICNPASGSAGKNLRVREEVLRVLAGRGYDCRTEVTGGPGQVFGIAEKAVKSGSETVIVLGGDGTVSEAAGALVNTGVSLAVIPAGTGNDYCKTLRIPRDPMKALDVFLNEKARKTDAGTVNGRVFVNEIGTGFDVDVLRRSAGFKKHLHGLLPYLLGVISAIAHYHTYPVSYKTDVRMEGSEEITVFSAALGKMIGGGIPIAPEADPRDGLLEVAVIRRIPSLRLPLRLASLMRGRILGFPETVYERARTVSFSSPGMFVNVDGEILPMDKAEVSVLPGALLVHRPALKGED